MRWLLRLIVFWAISAPLFYVYGLPAMLDMLTEKARTESFDQCLAELTNQKQIGSANSPLSQQQGEQYCLCISARLIFSRADLMDVLQQKQPSALQAQAQSLSEHCTRELQQSLGFLPAN